MHAAWKLDQGSFAKAEISSAKSMLPIPRTRPDTAIQLNGRVAILKTHARMDLSLCRQARLVDGADEVHKMVLSRLYAEHQLDFWKWG